MKILSGIRHSRKPIKNISIWWQQLGKVDTYEVRYSKWAGGVGKRRAHRLPLWPSCLSLLWQGQIQKRTHSEVAHWILIRSQRKTPRYMENTDKLARASGYSNSFWNSSIHKPDHEEFILASPTSLPPLFFLLSISHTRSLTQAYIIFTLVIAIVWSPVFLPPARIISSAALLRLPQRLLITFNEQVFFKGLFFAKPGLGTGIS